MKLRRFLIVFGALCLIGALSLAVYNMAGAATAGKKAEAVVDRLITDIPSNPPTDTPKKVTPTIVIDGVRYLGYINIPRLNLNLPVAADYSFEQLSKSPALYSGAFTDGNAVVAAHNYVTHFGRLRRLKVGDELIFTDAEGTQYLYTVGWTEDVLPSNHEQMVNKNGWDLTLFTCNYDKSVRYTVRCVK